MPILDIFNGDAFGTLELSDAINVIPNQYGRLAEMNLFPAKPVRNVDIFIEFKNGVLNLIPSGKRGAPSNIGARPKRQGRSFTAIHLPHEESISADDVQGVRKFGTEADLLSVMDLVVESLLTHRQKHDITLEHLRMGALKGLILDADGSVLNDIFAEFGVVEKAFDFDLTGVGDPVKSSLDVVRHMEDNLLGDVMDHVHCLCSPEFMDALVGHAAVKRAWDFHRGSSELLSQDPRKGFNFNGVIYEEYRGVASNLQEDGTSIARKFIPAGDARFFPLGTFSSFATYFAPADFMETVNTPGQAFYAKTKIQDYERGVDILSQSNPLPLPLRPALLVKGTA